MTEGLTQADAERAYTAGATYQELLVSEHRILRHFLHNKESLSGSAHVRMISADAQPAPVFSGATYLANIGTSPDDPLLLELRFAPIDLTVDKLMPAWTGREDADKRVRIALLMTNERYWQDLAMMGDEFYSRLKVRGVEFDAIIAPESLGTKLSQEIARTAWERDHRNVYLTSFQKGKPTLAPDGTLHIGSPKPWVEETAGLAVSSGTSHAASRQKLYLDQLIAHRIAELGLRVLLVDDARLTQGTIDTALAITRKCGIQVSGIATVLNEGDDAETIEAIPYIGLTKLPLFAPVPGGLKPIPGTFAGLRNFYIEQP